MTLTEVLNCTGT